ncbi:cupin domain-containing protein [Nitrosomonas supralitoralis]|uniref:dTDP-4-dehydrorhamnose 3,5-epimerase n=1 Tax=Nitrosomonas supralitoralis TaxID=2116706 RepID=A0A2P7NZK9_9PROT|nr:dTDP-4-dehydrorhamnose 3,5-epimerase family protein [Nitrosomonas supralitoralis]PSJ18919.1 dTDP-4-dehydrorhamnose 3,5-epimerase [Nitrosomonas supralitoralis]
MLKEEAIKDHQTVTAEGEPTSVLLTGVKRQEVPNIITANGTTTELYRPEWEVGPEQIQHMIHVIMRANALSAWHVHDFQIDTIFVTNGSIKLVLFDDRDDSATKGQINVFHLSRLRPTLITIPPGIWHGLQNMDNSESSFINYFNNAYIYTDPDEWRLPFDTDKIPYRFE